MYFGSYGLRAPWLDKCLKTRVSEDPSKSKRQMGSNSAEISIKPLLPNLLNTVKVIKFKKILS